MNQMLLHSPRTTLMKLLDDLFEKQVIYINAPAGFGKTVSSVLWLEHRRKISDLKQSWISLDEHDNKIVEFCRRFISALARLQIENTALRELVGHSAFSTNPIEFTLYALGVLADMQYPYVLIVDDLHIIQNEEILKILPILFKRLPGNYTVLILSRNVPPESFSDMVIKGDLSVVDAEYLQFTSGEIQIFFNKNGRYISAEEADEIFASTGGWAIGIRTLLLSKEKPYNIDFTDKYLDNFLKTHVWERWDSHIKKFMTLVCVARELTPELCEWLTADENLLKKVSSEEILSELVRESAFLRETGNNTYRFHDLFRDFLLNLLEEEGEETAIAQWGKAGSYYYNKEDFFRSIEYNVKAKNGDGIAKSLYHMYDYNSPYASIEDTLYAIHTSVNDSLVEKYPFLLETLIWAAYVEGQPDNFEKLLDEYYRLSPKIIIQNPRSATILMLLRFIDYRINFIDVLKTLRLIPFKKNAKIYSPSISQNMPLFHRSCRDFSDFAFDTDKNLSLVEKTVSVILKVEFPAIKNCLQAGILYERGNLNEAYEYALTACANISDGCSAEIRFCAMMIFVSVLCANGQNIEADKILNNVNDMIEQDKVFYLKPNLQAYLVRLRMSEGDKEAAKEWLKQNNDNSILEKMTFFRLYQHFTTARAYIVIEDYNHAILSLQKLLQLGERYNRTLDIIEARILLAIAYWKKGRGEQSQSTALTFLEQAIITAHKYGYTQIFANEGTELVSMLHRLQRRSVQRDYIENLPTAFVKTLYVAAVATSKRSRRLTDKIVPAGLTFTDRQKMVMQLMCDGYSRNEIVEKMGLKSSGVKSHIELIYRKLDVPNIVEAILKIKELDLLNDK